MAELDFVMASTGIAKDAFCRIATTYLMKRIHTSRLIQMSWGDSRESQPSINNVLLHMDAWKNDVRSTQLVRVDLPCP
jgi:hypothetical protein